MTGKRSGQSGKGAARSLLKGLRYFVAYPSLDGRKKELIPRKRKEAKPWKEHLGKKGTIIFRHGITSWGKPGNAAVNKKRGRKSPILQFNTKKGGAGLKIETKN